MKNIVKALIEAKQNFKPIIKSKANSHFKSKYAPLDAILDAIGEALGAAGLVLVQPTIVKDDKTILRTILIHGESGEQIESELVIPPQSDPQKLGAAMTYYRRFSICSLLAIAPDEDDDGTIAKINAVRPQSQPPPKAAPVDPMFKYRQAMKDCFAELDWSIQQQKDWAQTISKHPSKDWIPSTWEAAIVDLHNQIDCKQSSFLPVE